MKRRSFVSLMGSGAVLLRGKPTRAAGVAQDQAESRSRSGKPVKMHLGTQQGPTTSRMLQYLKRHGVNHICGYPPDPGAKRSLDRRRSASGRATSVNNTVLRWTWWPCPSCRRAISTTNPAERSCWGKVPSAIATSNTFRR